MSGSFPRWLSLLCFLFKLSAKWRLHCQIPHGSSAFNTVWPSNTHIFARSSLVSLVQTAVSSKPAEYFRFKRACLLDPHPTLSSLLALECLLREFTVASWPIRGWKLEWHEVLADVWPCASTLMAVFSFIYIFLLHRLTHVQTEKGKAALG